MKKLLLIPLLFISFFLTGQDAGVLYGVVKEDKTGEPIPFVNIILEKEGVQIAGGISDFDGNFMIKDICKGSYTLKASMVGYKSLMIAPVLMGMEDSTLMPLEMQLSDEISIRCCCFCCFIPAPAPNPIIDLFVEADSLAAIMDTTLSSFELSEHDMAEVSAFPNPSSGIFSLQNMKESTEILIMDTSGKTIKSMFVEKDEVTTINLSNHHPGTYIIKYQEEDQVKVLRLIMY